MNKVRFVWFRPDDESFDLTLEVETFPCRFGSVEASDDGWRWTNAVSGDNGKCQFRDDAKDALLESLRGMELEFPE